MTPKRKKLCRVCAAKPAKALTSIYKCAIAEPAFCSRRCAAEYGLRVAGGEGDDGLNWCDQHGWYENARILNGGCPDCPNQEGDE